jgi:hypothetical protein
VILAPATTLVKAGETFRFPPQGAIKIQPTIGKEQITLFASEQPFPAGQLLRGAGVADRVVHAFYATPSANNDDAPAFDPVRIVKKTITIETK